MSPVVFPADDNIAIFNDMIKVPAPILELDLNVLLSPSFSLNVSLRLTIRKLCTYYYNDTLYYSDTLRSTLTGDT